MHHHCINDTKFDQEIVLHELAMIGKWFPNADVPSQIDMYTYVNGDVEISFFYMTTDNVVWAMKLMVESEGITK
jgi:hypothetical protein